MRAGKDYRSTLKKLFFFGLIGISGVIINTSLLLILTSAGLFYVLASIIATEIAIITNFIGNHFITFRNESKNRSVKKKFIVFQSISLITIIGTVSLLSLFVTLFGSQLLLIWNVVAISIMFLLNYILNSKITWKGNSYVKKVITTTLMLMFILFFGTAASASELVAISQLGYHPDEPKQVVIYTNALNGTATILSSSSAATIPLHKALDYDGNNVECQGNNACLIGDFSNITQEGTYTIVTSNGSSEAFQIGTEQYEKLTSTLLAFFDATEQQDSAYHNDFHVAYDPSFPYMADGSFILTSDQAAVTTIRLGSAYRRNPDMFDSSARKHIIKHVNYLSNLQGLQIKEGDTGFRLSPSVKIQNGFVPGPTNKTTLDVYTPGDPPKLLETVPVTSLCNKGNETSEECVLEAAKYYKCQIDEPCLNITYSDSRGSVTGRDGFAVSTGWLYEFGCFLDIDISKPLFSSYNPCMIFDPQTNQKNTIFALHAFVQSYPAVHDSNSIEGDALLERAKQTYNFVMSNYNTVNTDNAGHLGTASFLLYDYTGNTAYLKEAYNMRTIVPVTLISDSTRGNEFYWEEFIRHKQAILELNLSYTVTTKSPEDIFTGKLIYDYKDRGPTALSKNAERVFQFDPNIQFQNSRYMLTEGVIAAKTREFSNSSFISEIAHRQLQWLTGMNAVQIGVGLNAPVESISFIFGIGQFPTQFHSRYLVDSGYRKKSDGKIIGVRGTSLLFKDGDNYTYLDGVHSIMGHTFGSIGNAYNNETQTNPYLKSIVFDNGATYIPGWISGAFDVTTNPDEIDVIFNYDDNINTYEFTETTNEIVATAIELSAYLDAQLNNRSPHRLVYTGVVNNTNRDIPDNNSTNDTSNIPDTNQTQMPDTNQTQMPDTNQTQPPTSDEPTNITQGITSATNATKVGTTYISSETDTISFDVNLPKNYTVTWRIDGLIVHKETSNHSSLDWTPSILYTGSEKVANITAEVANTTTIAWNIVVHDVINPFFSAIGGGDDTVGSANTQLNIITHYDLISTNSVSATITAGGVKKTYTLNKNKTNNLTQEIEWIVPLTNVDYGNNYLSSISLTNDKNETLNYALGLERAHYRNFPAPPVSSSRSSSSSSSSDGGGGALVNDVIPTVVYSLFAQDILLIGEKQQLVLDASIPRGDIDKIRAIIKNPHGASLTKDLELLHGSESYGTWGVNFSVINVGTYTLETVIITVNNVETQIDTLGQSFYLAADTATTQLSNLEIVYSTLNSSRVKLGSVVLFQLDAKDKDGITGITANVNSDQDTNFTLPLVLISGNENYGTWSGTINAKRQDTTYTVKSVLLSNHNDSVLIALDDRSFYVEAEPELTNMITGNIIGSALKLKGWSLDTIRKLPFFPTLFGFVIMTIIILIIIFGKQIEGLYKKPHR